MLVLAATPIGNLQDVSDRLRSVLGSSDCILCEDTRHTGLLLQALQIAPPRLLSMHRFNEASREEEVLGLLRRGCRVALVSDAGMPGISDPGAALVRRCHQEGISVTAVPGPCAFATAYALAGSSSDRVQFLGFLPKSMEERRLVLRGVHRYDGDSVVYESPHRVAETVSLACDLEPLWEVLLARELTKMYEEVVRTTASVLRDRLSGGEVRGECTLVFLKAPARPRLSDGELVSSVLRVRQMASCSLKEAADLVAKSEGIPSREVYQLCVRS